MQFEMLGCPFSDVIICARFYLYLPSSFFGGKGGGADPPKLAVPIDRVATFPTT